MQVDQATGMILCSAQAAAALGVPLAGGPGNNSASHSIATVVERLRADPAATGLCTALGWYATKHACGIYSGTPPARLFRELDAAELISAPPARSATADYVGP